MTQPTLEERLAALEERVKYFLIPLVIDLSNKLISSERHPTIPGVLVWLWKEYGLHRDQARLKLLQSLYDDLRNKLPHDHYSVMDLKEPKPEPDLSDVFER
jgi:hypothetical protein